jgi:hypothetical protein
LIKEGKTLRKLVEVSECQRIPSKDKDLGVVWRREMEEKMQLDRETKKTGAALREFGIMGRGKYFKRKRILVIVTRN